jgi:hypothetical protein
LSLHEGFAWLARGGRIEFGDGKGAQHGDGAVCAGGDGAFGGAVTEVDVDDANGLERRQGFGGGEIEACSLELLFDCAVEQEGERGDI